MRYAESTFAFIARNHSKSLEIARETCAAFVVASPGGGAARFSESGSVVETACIEGRFRVVPLTSFLVAAPTRSTVAALKRSLTRTKRRRGGRASRRDTLPLTRDDSTDSGLRLVAEVAGSACSPRRRASLTGANIDVIGPEIYAGR